jgi:tetratricopeptide (TPR) repeat protein
MDREKTLKKALYLSKKGHYKTALKYFKELDSSTLMPRYLSYYALCMAKAEKNYEDAISLGVKAVKTEFYHPEIYLNLGRILSASGRKAFAFRAYKKGLGYDSTHQELIKEINEMGIRRNPVVSSLPRENPVNRFLGMLANKLRSLTKTKKN